MMRPEIEALIHGAVDNTLTREERETLRRLVAEDLDVSKRVADLNELNELLASLGAAEVPPGLLTNVLARVTRPAAPQPEMPLHPTMHSPHRAGPVQFLSRSTPKRGETVNKKMIFGLAAAAAVVLAVITYTSYPPATEGTEATIGAAQRAQTPQIASKDVGLADTSTQDILQTDTWDAIMKDEDLRASLQNPELRKMLQDSELRDALRNEAVRNGLRNAELLGIIKAKLSSRGSVALSQAELGTIRSAQARAVLSHDLFSRALARHPNLAAFLLDTRTGRALSSNALGRALNDPNFDAAMRSQRFAQSLMSSGVKK